MSICAVVDNDGRTKAKHPLFLTMVLNLGSTSLHPAQQHHHNVADIDATNIYLWQYIKYTIPFYLIQWSYFLKRIIY